MRQETHTLIFYCYKLFIRSDSILREEYPNGTYTGRIQAIQEDTGDRNF